MSGTPGGATRRLRARRSHATERAYESDWAAFASWCALVHVVSLPAGTATVILYVRSLAGNAKLSTVRRKLAAIQAIHHDNGHALDVRDHGVQAAVTELGRRRAALASPRPAATEADVARLVRALPSDVAGVRDRSFILTAWLLELRPSELVGLDVTDLVVSPRNITLALRGRGGAGHVRTRVLDAQAGSDLCAVHWLRAWLRLLVESSGPLFRSVNRYGRIGAVRLTAQTVRLVLHRAALAAGVPAERVSADGLRASGRAATPRGR